MGPYFFVSGMVPAVKKEDGMDYYADGTVEFIGANGRLQRTKVEDVRAEDLAVMDEEDRNHIIDLVMPDEEYSGKPGQVAPIR